MRWVLLGMLLLATQLAIGASAVPRSHKSTPRWRPPVRIRCRCSRRLAWEKASRAYDRARDNFARDRPPEQTAKYIDEATAALAGATDTMRLGRVNFGAVLTSRANALSAGADTTRAAHLRECGSPVSQGDGQLRTRAREQIANAGGRGGADLSDRRTRSDQGRDPARRATAARASRGRKRRKICAANAGAGARGLRGSGPRHRRGPLRHRSCAFARQAGEGTGEPCAAPRRADQGRPATTARSKNCCCAPKRRSSTLRSRSAPRRT